MVEDVAARVRSRLESISTQAIYDILGALSRAGLARRIEPAGSPARRVMEWLLSADGQKAVVDAGYVPAAK